MSNSITNARVYVGTYRKYSEGSISGKWLDLSDYSTYADFIDACKEIHKDEEDPELMFLDWEGPEGFISESSVNPNLFDLMEAVGDWDEERIEALIIYIDMQGNQGDDASDLISDFEDSYNGYFDGYNPREDFAEQLLEDTGDLNAIPENLRYYFDYKAFARDLFLSDYDEQDGHIFRNC